MTITYYCPELGDFDAHDGSSNKVPHATLLPSEVRFIASLTGLTYDEDTYEGACDADAAEAAARVLVSCLEPIELNRVSRGWGFCPKHVEAMLIEVISVLRPFDGPSKAVCWG